MKTNKPLLIRSLFAGTLSLMLIAGCKGPEKADKTATKDETGKILDLPCQGPESFSDENYFRASQVQTSQDLSFAKEKALLAAKQELASKIEGTLSSVSDKYANERQFGSDSEFEGKMESLTREVVKQKLVDVKVICQKSSVLENGQYRAFVAIEMSKDAVLNDINNRISSDQKLQIDYDKMKFEQIYNEEMKKLKEEKQ